MSILEHCTVSVEHNSVSLLIHGVGRIVMQPRTAVELATKLLDTANELEPGSGGFPWPPEVTP